jgi:hypothetical protein
MQNQAGENGNNQKSALARGENGRLVVTGRPEKDINWLRLVHDMREERTLEIWRHATGKMEATFSSKDKNEH